MNPAFPLLSEREPVPRKWLHGYLSAGGVSLKHHGEIPQAVRCVDAEETPCPLSLPTRKIDAGRSALAKRDANATAQVATASAVMNLACLPLCRLDKVLRIACKHAPPGGQMSHSGPVTQTFFERQFADFEVGRLCSVQADSVRADTVCRSAFATGRSGK